VVDRRLQSCSRSLIRSRRYEGVEVLRTLNELCVCVSASVCLSTIISLELHVRSLPDFLCVLPMSMAQPSSDVAVIHYVLPVLWMLCYVSSFKVKAVTRSTSGGVVITSCTYGCTDDIIFACP